LFTGGVALFFVVPDWADDISNRTIGFRKSSNRRAESGHEVPRKAGTQCRKYGGKNSGEHP
jgi:hypothetical protein